MNLRLVLPLVAGSLAITGMVYTFVSQSSPYVTVAQAKTMRGKNLHLPGAMQKETLHVSPREKLVTFTLKDDEGNVVPVRYSGHPPANMGQATRVVVIGGMKDGVFHSDRMLLKCPSKYEAENNMPRSATL